MRAAYGAEPREDSCGLFGLSSRRPKSKQESASDAYVDVAERAEDDHADVAVHRANSLTRRPMGDRRIRYALLAFMLLLPSCSLGRVDAPSSGPSALTADDVRWLNRVTFGIDTATATRYRQVGRARFLSEQLQLSTEDPPPLAAAIAAIPVTQHSA